MRDVELERGGGSVMPAVIAVPAVVSPVTAVPASIAPVATAVIPIAVSIDDARPIVDRGRRNGVLRRRGVIGWWRYVHRRHEAQADADVDVGLRGGGGAQQRRAEQELQRGCAHGSSVHECLVTSYQL